MLQHMPAGQGAQPRRTIERAYRQDEQSLLAALLSSTQLDSASRQRIADRAQVWINTLRRQGWMQGQSPVVALLEQFPLASPEGVRLMGLAEALLRVPDAATAHCLVADKLGGGDWRAHLDRASSPSLNAAVLGLMLGAKISTCPLSGQVGHGWQRQPQALLQALLRGVIGHSLGWFARQFVFASNPTKALLRADKFARQGYSLSFDMLGEGARCGRDAQRYYDHYRQMIAGLAAANSAASSSSLQGLDPARGSVSIKLSALHPRYEPAQRQRVIKELVPRLLALAQLAQSAGISLTLDAEESWRLDLSLDVFAAVLCSPQLAGWDGFGLAVQAYQKRALAVLGWLVQLAAGLGRKIPLRLVKGAYWDSEIKATQQGGYSDYPVFTRKASTDLNYQACAQFLLAHRQCFYPQFATHNPYTVATVLELERQLSTPAQTQTQTQTQSAVQSYEFQRLHGMGEGLYKQVLQQGLACRVYAPVGQKVDLLAYLIRRLLENGANSAFVHQLHDRRIDALSLLQDPWAKVAAWTRKSHPQIPLPRALFIGQGLVQGLGEGRLNSLGCDLNDSATLQALQEDVAAHYPSCRSLCGPLAEAQFEIRNPARYQQLLARVALDSPDSFATKLDRAERAFASWAARPAPERGECLRDLADSLENHRAQLIALCVKEGGKTLADSIDEVREAVDFCRYYAERAAILFAESPLQPRGVVLCISPWNFPLAIFVGQIAAALATGNTVLAKPAMQSLLMARCVVDMMSASGLPQHCCQLLQAPGQVVGEQVLPDPRIQALLFTGSLDTGHWLNRALAQREAGPCPLIAETGGQNAMLVDATALLEQVVDGVISSAFHSAGQRCSALRVLFVQQDIADELIAMLVGAMAELVIGDPADISSDLGPLIDGPARAQCEAHCRYLQSQPNEARLIYQCALSRACEEGYFFPPQLYEINNMTLLKTEVFGPIVHLIRFPAGGIDGVLAQIANSGYGLTLGIQSRIDSTCKALAQRAEVGNVYINRNMTGAVVGVQPFGGRGLSGTGPKAGGPLYLQRLVRWPPSSDGLQAGAGNGLSPAHSGGLLERELLSFRPAQKAPHRVAGSIANAEVLKQAHQAWVAQGAASRISSIAAAFQRRDTSDEQADEQSGALDALLETAEEAMLAAARDLLLAPRLLPGPTGESNSYQLESRGLVAIVLEQISEVGVFLRQLLGALLAGNAVLILSSPDPALMALWQGLQVALAKAGVPAQLLARAELDEGFALLDDWPVRAVCVAPKSPLYRPLARRLANREGAICPLISAQNPSCLIARLSYEKTICSNTAAASGNVKLLSLGE
ncbi:MAG: bifunctional proline dehydrogenase/L-glutamate gamma-semialdehyde dehydrogenase PutA [Gammaproteobacteria bacterium]|nr:bifunctional proline dehydrogenase/L-glutamate gamma-semialdehyde dehydrogenase PutA [Gammaproteobacteria bacterium]MBQ0840280.1 bifunctional proline dehydrogenase/L-glutamate gamma-semialdehyde dehydrogenase PutA [Gammaproteobacteria bacterium]